MRFLKEVIIGTLLALVAMIALSHLNVAPAQKPGGYAGRPPTNMSYPGRCWCARHGPRGGCMRWVCRKG